MNSPAKPEHLRMIAAVGVVIFSVLLSLAGCANTQTDEDDLSQVSLPPAFLKIRPWLASGAEPEVEHFASLAGHGYKWVLSVDSIAPNVEAAESAGLRYIHLPISYDTVPVETIAALQALTEQAKDDPIFVHCHHGRHRGPAVAAILLLLEEPTQREEALEVLREAGTSAEYSGLWAAVEDFDPSAHAGVDAPELTSVRSASPVAEIMAALDRHFDRLQLELSGATETQGHSETAAALLVSENFREIARIVRKSAEYDADFLNLLQESETLALHLHHTQKHGLSEKSREAFLQLKSSCRSCHRSYRD